MKAIIRNFLFVLKRFKTSSILNILGLSVAFAVFTVTMIQVNYDLSYDKQFRNRDQIYFLTMMNPSNGRGTTMSTPMAKEISDKFPGVKNYCLLNNNGPDDLAVDVQGKEGVKQKFATKVIPATAGLIDVFTPEIIAGTTKGMFDQQGKGMITESEALKLFGNTNPIGKTVYFHIAKHFYNNQNTDHITIQAVCKDFQKNCSLANGIYTLLPDDQPENYNYNGYFKIEPRHVAKLLSALNSEKFFGKENWQEMKKDPNRAITIELTPLNKAHFDFEKGRLSVTLSFLFIGILTLIIAYINFLNFSVAISPARVKALNIHKIIGAGTTKLKWMLASEAAIFSLIAFLLSLIYILLLKSTFIGQYFSADVSLKANIPIFALIAVSSVVFGLLFGWYPAHYIVSFQPAVALSGSFSMSKQSNRLRNVLIAVQFTAAITMIIVALFIQLQSSFMQKRPWGIQKENIVYVPYGQLKINMQAFGEELKQDPRILDYTAAQFIPGNVGMSWGRSFEGKQVNATVWPVHPNFLHFFGVKVLQGRDFQVSDSVGKTRAIIFNEAFVRKYQFDNTILGKDFSGFDKNLTIVGIAKNVNYSSLRDSIQPMGFAILEEGFMNWFFIKLSGNDTQGAIQSIQKTWSKYSSEDFDLKFIDQSIEKLYKNETNLAKLISLFGLVTIIIAVMGVYGLVVFNTRYKAKEIAIRKVNGASIGEIMLMLNRNVLILLSVAYIIGVPIAYYIVHRWLEQFAYKIPIYWWVFAAAGILIFIVTAATISLHSYKAAATNPVEAVKGE